ncbi:MAG: hypothetical protein Q9225_003481 [Loekoesia sp. 1 TL-2023]
MSQGNDENKKLFLPISTSSLILPTASQNVSRTITSLNRSTLSITNRLSSIHRDSLFVQRVAEHCKLPVIANERCGSWYIPPALKAGSVYFKSTDGHQGQWSFSTRRLNLQVLDIVGNTWGCIIVDSTRRGKSMPDALSKTVPIWCAVMNRLLFEDAFQDTGFCTPESVIGPSEHSQVEARLDGLVDKAKRLQLDLSTLHQKISKPLRPIWITPDAPLPDISPNSPYHLIICLTVSRLPSCSEGPSDTYIQGAADDSESWARGLTPALFWQHKDTLLSSTEDELPDLVHSFLDAPRSYPKIITSPTFLIKPTQCIYIAAVASVLLCPEGNWDAIVVCAPTTPFEEVDQDVKVHGQESRRKILHLPCPKEGKLASRALRSQLHRVPPFVDAVVQESSSLQTLQKERPPLKILFTCLTGSDLSGGAALVALCSCVDEAGNLKAIGEERGVRIDKAFIHQRLAWITQSKSDVNPSRETLQAVNICLMGR